VKLLLNKNNSSPTPSLKREGILKILLFLRGGFRRSSGVRQ